MPSQANAVSQEKIEQRRDGEEKASVHVLGCSVQTVTRVVHLQDDCTATAPLVHPQRLLKSFSPH